MDKSELKRRRKLNTEQLEVLGLLYKFRFGSNDLIAKYFGKKDRSFVYKRLNILLEQGLVGKRFDSSYRLQGKPAAYYLTPAGARKLQENRQIEINIKSIYKDKTVSEQFIRHCMDIFAVYLQLRAEYGDQLKFFTKANLNHEKFDYFPQPLPDAYIRLKIGDEEKQYFLDIYHDDQPFFAAVRRIKQYVAYDEEADWSATETELPTILAVCDSPNLTKRLQKQITKALDAAWEDNSLLFALATKTQLLSGEAAIWQPANAPEEPNKTLLEL